MQAFSKQISDPFISTLLENSETLGKYKVFLEKLGETKDINNFIELQVFTGKKFWDKYKEFEK
jgi:hypothetical protein